MKAFARRYARNYGAVIGLLVLLAVVAVALLAPVLYEESPWLMVGEPLVRPFADAAYPFGTDMLGRDITAGMLYGARVSLLVGVSSALVALAIGVTVGAVAGFYRGRTDAVLSRITEFFQTIPAFLLAIILVAVLKPTLGTIVFALGVTSWTSVARLVRAEFLSLREREYVRAAVAVGAGDVHLIFREILPNAWTPIIVSTGLLVANAILSEAGLAFLGLGDPNVVSWGSMIGLGRDALRTGWYMTAIPGLAVVLTVLALNLLSDGLQAALNPRLRRVRTTAPA